MSTKFRYGVSDLQKEYGPLTFGKLLESYRLADEVSQKEFSKRLGISQQSLCDMEKGRKIPSPERAAKIAKKLSEPADYWIKLALQDMLREQHLHFEVSLQESKKTKAS
jgi:transcriptional regulator with XRE-family HTH domain